jgi:hypothetical protein
LFRVQVVQQGHWVIHPPIVETPEALLAKSKTKRVESATGPKILAPGFFCPQKGTQNRPSQALTRSFNDPFGAWLNGNF